MDLRALESVALSIRTLSMDGVQAANSGHPGLPMGCAEIGAVLYGEIMKHNPKVPEWINRDRFVLSAGHGSMFLYSLLHLSGYGLPLEELKKFRQLNSKTPGHPEYGHTTGVETTTGPLGQGVTNAVGLAIAQEMMAARFNTAEHKVIDHHVYALAGDGCLMEGITSEAASLAGHLKLGRLIAFYDSNKITIEGSTDLAFTEDVAKRFDAYGWQVLQGDGHDMEAIASLVEKAKAETGKPSLIILKTTIGKGSPNMAGTHKVHGAPLGADEIKATRKALGIGEDEAFYVHPDAVSFFAGKQKSWQGDYDKWKALFDQWASQNPEKKREWDSYFSGTKDLVKEIQWPEFAVGDKLATRQASGKSLLAAAKALPNLVGGSADLAPSNNTAMPDYGDFSSETPEGRTIHYGVREHAMGAIANGIALYGGLKTFCATFMVFADYMRGSIRLAALMGLPVTYVFTHDSIYVGEDGPTHQPIEHLASLRAIPNLNVLRPGDAQETAVAWEMALESTSAPTVLALTRQGLEVYEKADSDWKNTVRKGAYIAYDCEGTPDVVIAATGSEVSLAIAVAKELEGKKKVRVVSIMCRDIFMVQDEAFKQSLLPEGVRTLVVEVGISLGWEGIASSANDLVTIDRFGASGPAEQVAAYFGVTKEAVIKKIG